MGDDKGKKKPAKEKKPHPFRNGLIIGAIIGAFCGMLIGTPSFMSGIKEPIAKEVKTKVDEGKSLVGSGLEESGKAISDTGTGIKKSDTGEPTK